MSAWAVVVAAGRGTRLGSRTPKALTPLRGEPLLAWSLDAIAKASSLSGVVVVCGEDWKEEAESLVRGRFGKRGRVVAGGATRQESSRRALDRIGGDADRVVVHDAARPLAGPELFQRVIAGTERAAGAICAVPVTDTIKSATGDVVVATVERDNTWRAQTPQGFRTEVLLRAHADAQSEGVTATDDAALLERIGETVLIVPGDEQNIKITTAADLALAEALLSL